MSRKTLELLEWSRLTQHWARFAATDLGSEIIRRLVPPQTLAESVQLLAETQEMIRLEEESSLSFRGVENIEAALERSRLQGVLSGLELLHIATTLGAARQVRRVIEAAEEIPLLQERVVEVKTFPELEQVIHHCIDDQGDVTERASPKLSTLRDRQRTLRQQIQGILQRLLQTKASALQEGLITQRSDRFVLPVKQAQKDSVPGIVHDASSTGATLYVEPQSTVNLNNQLRQVQRQIEVETERICRDLSEKVWAVQGELAHLLDTLTHLDLALARARYSQWLEGVPPTLTDAPGPMTLRQFRHPLLLWQEREEEQQPVVPIDIRVADGVRVVAITGPNTGGKTVTLKSIGLAVLMAKAGLLIPAQAPVTLPWFDQVLADIGDEQSLQQSLSTFSGHIRRIQEMVSALTERSLVLLDEVGAGTDPSEGTALAIALLKHLADQARLTIATTHFGALKTLKYQDDRFENASVEFNDVTLAPTYRLQWGIPGRSNALSIAQRLGLDTDIVARAAGYLNHDNQDLNAVIADLEGQRRAQTERNTEAAHLLRQAEGLHNQLALKAAELKRREQDLKQQQTEAVDAAIRDAKAEIARVIRKLQQGPQSAQVAQAATAELAAMSDRFLPKTAPVAKPPKGFRPQVGDRIRLPQLGQTAEVISPVTDEGELGVRFGILKMTVNLSEIESLQGEKAELPPKPEPTQAAPTPPAPDIRTSQNTVDLRGQRVHDAEVVLEDAIANAQGPLWVIHGHGTGRLRRGVQDFLKRHPGVKDFEFAEQSDGGTGVTIVRCR